MELYEFDEKLQILILNTTDKYTKINAGRLKQACGKCL